MNLIKIEHTFYNIASIDFIEDVNGYEVCNITVYGKEGRIFRKICLDSAIIKIAI